MKNLLFASLMILTFNSFVFAQKIIFPKEFPEELIGKKICGSVSTSGKMYGGSTAYLDVPIELYISKDDGIYVRYNIGEKFGKNEWGSTNSIFSLKLWKTEIIKDKYNNVLGKEYHYEIPLANKKTYHEIEAIFVYDFYGSNISPPKKTLYVDIFIPNHQNGSISTAYRGINVCGEIKTKEEIYREREIAEKERQERLAEEKRKQELLEQKRQEIIPQIEAKIPNQILEASELWVENQNILLPLNSSRHNILDRIEKGLINHFSQDTVNIHVISSSSIDNDFLKSLNQGNHSIKGNLNENTDYPFSEEFKKEIQQKSLVKGKAVDVYKPFRIDLKVEMRDSILLKREYFIIEPKDNLKQIKLAQGFGFKGHPIYIRTSLNGGNEFYYKSKSGLKTVQANWKKNVPKDIIVIESTYSNEKWLGNTFKIEEKSYTVVEQKPIIKKEK
jgi:hypothetical protein